EPVIYKITMYYIYGHHEILRELSSQDGLVFIVTYLLLSITYFSFESYFGTSVGKYLLKMRTAIVKNVKGNKVLRSVLRATIKVSIIFLSLPWFCSCICTITTVL
ncbi:MAG: hypothetical protein J7L63_04080, partial [Thermoplasmata archaeon]|nr:hypothetical protein [Thermoplasmata archaeon]